MKKAYALLFDGYADWELGHVLAELRRLCKVEVATAGFSDKAVVSMGGLRVIPDVALPEVNPDDVLLCIVPGGHLWEGDYPVAGINHFLTGMEEAGIPVAAICAATTVVARAGLLRGRRHTSNSLAYLTKMVPEYREGALYVDELAVRDRHVITASGLGAIELTMEVFHELDLVPQEIRTMWYDAVKHGIYPENMV